jgi:hypothetical protein
VFEVVIVSVGSTLISIGYGSPGMITLTANLI